MNPVPAAVSVRQAIPADAALVADVLAEAFSDDPFLAWLFPGQRRVDLLPRYFRSVTQGLYLRHREVYLSEDHGAALWLPPNVAADAYPLLPMLAMFGRVFLAYGFAGLNRARTASEVMKANHPREPHVYLHAIGVRGSRQGQGVGSALLRHVTARCDREGRPAYLENSNPRNTPLYERHGFRAVGEWRASGGPPLCFMLRRPAAPPGEGGPHGPGRS
jgi:GNAT superfamily N-acetyltransferase